MVAERERALGSGVLRELSEYGQGYARIPASERDNGAPHILTDLVIALDKPLASIPYGKKGFFVFDPERIENVTTETVPFEDFPILVARLEEGMSVYHGDDFKMPASYADGENLRGQSCNIVCFREKTTGNQ
ncbi:MAG: hypothetical protein COY68_00210 [Candidatus Levybacteria bacterium CG_4_10_14_0_8_um_filter_35_23]|nr:MAG: hypothetical protein COY68_00210 [Candidatus Levybacteria bacterium CG_4_10_14_0_8_um_filter_35_23]